MNLRAKAIVGTVQDDPFDCRVENEIKSSLPKNFDVYHSGALTTPDLVIRDRKSGLCVGLEITNANCSYKLVMPYLLFAKQIAECVKSALGQLDGKAATVPLSCVQLALF